MHIDDIDLENITIPELMQLDIPKEEIFNLLVEKYNMGRVKAGKRKKTKEELIAIFKKQWDKIDLANDLRVSLKTDVDKMEMKIFRLF